MAEKARKFTKKGSRSRIVFSAFMLFASGALVGLFLQNRSQNETITQQGDRIVKIESSDCKQARLIAGPNSAAAKSCAANLVEAFRNLTPGQACILVRRTGYICPTPDVRDRITRHHVKDVAPSPTGPKPSAPDGATPSRVSEPPREPPNRQPSPNPPGSGPIPPTVPSAPAEPSSPTPPSEPTAPSSTKPLIDLTPVTKPVCDLTRPIAAIC